MKLWISGDHEFRWSWNQGIPCIKKKLHNNKQWRFINVLLLYLMECDNVLIQILLLIASIITHRALLWLYIFMNWFDMSFQGSFLITTVITYWALSQYLAFLTTFLMNWFHVSIYISFVFATEVAYLALVWLFVLMDWFNKSV